MNLHRILPLFYEVDPSHVRKQTGSFGLALTKHEENSTHSQDKVKQWRVALEKVASLSGWDTRNFRSDRELVKHIVEFVCSKIQLPSADSEVLETQVHVINKSRPAELEKNHFKVGPYGSKKGGKPFDDGACSAVKQLVICYDTYHILYIQAEYVDLDGISFWSDKHGSTYIFDNVAGALTTKTIETVTLSYPDELTSIQGSYEDSWHMPTQILSLTFHSNKRIYGLFGKENGTSFSIKVPGSKIGGLFGRFGNINYDLKLRALGAYLEPLSTDFLPTEAPPKHPVATTEAS